MCGEGAGQSTIPMQVKNDQNNSLITCNLFSYFDVWSAIINILIFVLIKTTLKSYSYRDLYRKDMPQIKISDKNV